MNLATMVTIVLLLIMLILGLYVIPRWRTKRAVRQVIQTFRKSNTLDKNTAKTADELGLQQRPFLERMHRIRDFKPYALDALARAGIIKVTEDGRVYLDEDALMESGLERRVYPRS